MDLLANTIDGPNSQLPCILDRQRRLPKTLRDHVRSASALSALKESLVANLSAKRQLSVAKLSAKRIFSLAKRDFLVANGRMAADFSSPVHGRLTSERKASPSRSSFINHSTQLLERSSAKLLVFTCTRELDRLRTRRRVGSTRRRRNHTCMHDHSRFQRDIDDVTGVSLSLSLSTTVLTKVTDAQYRKRFRASYNYGIQEKVRRSPKGFVRNGNERERERGGGGRKWGHERRARKRTGWKVHIESKTQVCADLPSSWRLTSTRTHSLPRTLVFRGFTSQQPGSRSLTLGPPDEPCRDTSELPRQGANLSANRVDFSSSVTPASPPGPTLRLRASERG